MRLGIEVTMQYELGDPVVFLAIEAARSWGQIVEDELLLIDSATVNRIDGEAGLGTRIWARVNAPELQLTYRATVGVQRPDLALWGIAAAEVDTLPAEAVTFLRPSRYCQSDMFPAFVTRHFGHLQGGAKVQAIRDWVAAELSYVPESSGPATTALDTFATRQGVCRDYAHMVCAFCRAAQIPARYASVYAPGVTPQDFHAVAEVWLQDGWHIVDATGMCRPDNTVLVAVGRDACDIAFMETFAPAQLLSQRVDVQVLQG